MKNRGYPSVLMGHNMLEILLSRVEPIVKQIQKIVKEEVQNQVIISLEQLLKMTLFVMRILKQQNVLVEILKQFIHFSTYMTRKY